MRTELQKKRFFFLPVNDPDVTFSIDRTFPPTPTSPYANHVTAWQILTNSALEVFPDSIPAPGILVGNTDTVHYMMHTNKIYRHEN